MDNGKIPSPPALKAFDPLPHRLAIPIDKNEPEQRNEQPSVKIPIGMHPLHAPTFSIEEGKGVLSFLSV
jgi:hypothetical protein